MSCVHVYQWKRSMQYNRSYRKINKYSSPPKDTTLVKNGVPLVAVKDNYTSTITFTQINIGVCSVNVPQVYFL